MFAKNVGLGTDEFVGFGQVRAAAVTDQFPCHPSDKWISRYAGESIRAAALPVPTRSCFKRLRGALKLISLPAARNGMIFSPASRAGRNCAQGPELVQDVIERIGMSEQEFSKARVVDKLNAQINGRARLPMFRGGPLIRPRVRRTVDIIV